MTETWFERQRRMADAFVDAIYQRWFTDAVFSAAITLPFDAEVRVIVGHDPQKLLPSPDKARPLTLRERVDLWARDYMTEQYTRMALSLYEPIFPDRMELAPINALTGRPYHTGSYVDWMFPGDEINLVQPRERTYEHKVAIVRMGETVNTAAIERLLADKRVRCLVIDIDSDGGDTIVNWNDANADPLRDLRRMRDAMRLDDLPEKMSIDPAMLRALEGRDRVVNKRDQGYLQHDPTKTHRRRRR